MENYEDRLLFALHGKYKELRDDNHVTPNEILVYDVASNTVEAVDLMTLPLRFPCGVGGRWSYEDLGRVVANKALLYRQSVVAHEINDEDPTAEPTCGTVVLVVPAQRSLPYRRLTAKARINPS